MQNNYIFQVNNVTCFLVESTKPFIVFWGRGRLWRSVTLQCVQWYFRLEFICFRSQAFRDILVTTVSCAHLFFGSVLGKSNRGSLSSQDLAAFVTHVCNIRGMTQRPDALYAARFYFNQDYQWSRWWSNWEPVELLQYFFKTTSFKEKKIHFDDLKSGKTMKVDRFLTSRLHMYQYY